MKCQKCKNELMEGNGSANHSTAKNPLFGFILRGLVLVLVISALTGCQLGGNNPLTNPGGQTPVTQKCDASAQVKADLFDEITSFLVSKNAGKSSSKFYASEKVVIVSMSEYDRSFNVTMKYYKPAKMNWEWDGNSIDVSTKKFKGFTAKMMITPKKTGASYVRFTNTKNNQEFKVLVIVTD